MANLDLLSATSRVEAPFIIATIAGKTFGLYNKKDINYNGQRTYVDYPNYMQSLDITKINGAVNTYTLTLVYTITPGADPNLFEKLFSKAKSDRLMTLKYGDASLPAFIYKEEVTLITSVRSNFNIQTNSITYTIQSVSQSIKLNAGTYNFSARRAKPSDVIKELLNRQDYNLTQIFTGMWDKDLVETSNLIASDDTAVDIDAKNNISVMDYLNYLVSCMRCSSDNSVAVRTSVYTIAVVDDTSGKFGGTYFMVKKIDSTKTPTTTADVYEIDVGYSTTNAVLSFSIDDNETYSILYDYSSQVNNQTDYVYRLNDSGEMEEIYSPNITKNYEQMKTTESDLTWWTNITQFPIKATIVIKGLLRPALLMNYVKLNVLFFGKKHNSSGLYIITKQVDRVSASGYQTTLNLTRVSGDNL